MILSALSIRNLKKLRHLIPTNNDKNGNVMMNLRYGILEIIHYQIW